MDRVKLIGGKKKAKCTQVLLFFHLKKNGSQTRKGLTGIDNRIEAMISDPLVHMYCAPGSQANWQIRFLRLMVEIFEGMGEVLADWNHSEAPGCKKHLDALDK